MKTKINIKEQILCEPIVIAQLFNFEGVRRIEQLTSDGVLDATLVKVNGRKVRQYDLVPTIQKYVEYLSNKAHKKTCSSKEVELKEQKLEAEIALKESQGEIHRIKADIAAGRYVDVEEVALDYKKFFVTFKRFALGMPARLVSMASDSLEPLEARRIEKEMGAEVKRMLHSFVISGYTQEEQERKAGKKHAKTKATKNEKVSMQGISEGGT